jgi:prophage regulatory protein
MNIQNATHKLILSDELAKIIPYSQNHLRRLEAAGDFPKRIRIGANRVAWLKDEVENWIADRVNSRQETE